MYEQANETINRGLSQGARLLLGAVAGLFGAFMILAAPRSEQLFGFYLFGAVCFTIALACVTRGRLRQFFGSLIGSAMFVAGLWYLVSELTDGALWSGSRSEPSAFNAVLYLIFIGLPGAAYVWKARFGLRRKK
jgi:hypothetical protein